MITLPDTRNSTLAGKDFKKIDILLKKMKWAKLIILAALATVSSAWKGTWHANTHGANSTELIQCVTELSERPKTSRFTGYQCADRRWQFRRQDRGVLAFGLQSVPQEEAD
ncbi:hypothetical protein BST61_g2268 [Cercospora zeina]